jgi:hypothetical protein
LSSDTEEGQGLGGERRFKSHANEKSNVDISLGGERACDGLKLEHKRGGRLRMSATTNSSYIHRTRTRTRTRTSFNHPHFACVFMVIGMPLLQAPASGSTWCFTLFCSTLLTRPLLFCSARICALTRILAITALQKAVFSRSSASQFLLLSTSSAMDMKGVRKP